MTSAARRVLNDCRFVLTKLEDEKDDREWRIQWVAVVALLRIVGHVLSKVDGIDEETRKVSNSLFLEWKSANPAHEIFREFIESERNNILKNYDFGVSEGPVRVMVGDSLEILDENIYRPMTDGAFAGEDGRTLVEKAITWWEEQLNRIDQIVISRI